MSIFTAIWAFLKKVFTSVEKDADKISITATEAVKTALNSGILGFTATVLDGLTKSNVPTEVVTFISNNINKLLAAELAIQGLPVNPTEADILAFEQAVLAAFNVTSDKSKLYTTLAAQIYGLIQDQVIADAGQKATFAQIVAIVEAAYIDYTNDQNPSTDDTNS